MGATRKRDCSVYKPGELVKGAAVVQPGPDGKTMLAVDRVGNILPIDETLAKRAFDEGSTIGKFCVTSGKAQYIYVDFTKKLNPTLEPYGIGKSFQEVVHLKLVKHIGTTRRRSKPNRRY